MKKRILWLAFYAFGKIRVRLNWIMKKLKLRVHIGSLINEKRILSRSDVHKRIKEIILQGSPALIARFGSNEAICMAEGIGIQLGLKKNFRSNTLQFMHVNAGLFPKSEYMARRFSEIACQAAQQVDILGYWDSFMQDYLVKNVCSSRMQITSLGALEPYTGDAPWSAALKGKRVLVIHPFKKTIENQYKNRMRLFDDPDVLPDFELTVVQAVQTIAGEKDDRFADWEEALNYMFDEAMKNEFDVAIIGCGAYGMPLAAKLKEAGKIAIHLGGATQLLFGIKGARWEKSGLCRLYNEYWVRPSEEETPKKAKQVEGACYW